MRNNCSFSFQRPLEPRSEYRTQFDWKPTAEPVAERVDRVKSKCNLFKIKSLFHQRPRTSETPTRKKPVEKNSVAVNTPARVELEVSKPKTFDKPTVSSSAKQNRLASEYQIRYRAQKPTRVKSFEAENVENRRKKPEQENHLEEQRAQSDDENAARHIDLGREFREKNPHGKLRSPRKTKKIRFELRFSSILDVGNRNIDRRSNRFIVTITKTVDGTKTRRQKNKVLIPIHFGTKN